VINQFRDLPEISQYEVSLNKSLLLLGTCKLRLEDAYVQLLDRLSIPEIKSLLDLHGWDNLQLQGKLAEHLGANYTEFITVVSNLEQNIAYLNGKLDPAGDFNYLVSRRRTCFV